MLFLSRIHTSRKNIIELNFWSYVPCELSLGQFVTKKDKSRFLFIRVQIIFKNRFKQEQNLGTMEDSFTNIFKLAELNGLTWKKFSHTNPVPSLPSDDQVLSAYAKCMKERVVFMLLFSNLVKF